MNRPSAAPDAAPDAAGEPTPLLLITGFLGSGKTTLINRWLRTRTGLRLGVLVNEFGQIGIDGALLRAGGAGDLLELSDGCVCCASGRELWEAAASLRARAGVTHLLVETSGIAEPAVLRQQYATLPPELAGRLALRGALCLVDTVHVEEAVRRRPEVRHQICEAERLLLSKIDLCDGERLSQVHQLLDRLGATPERAALRPDASLAEISETLAWALRAPRRAAATPSPAHAHPGQLGAASLSLDRPLLRGPLLTLLGELPAAVLRAKGFVRLSEGGLMVLQLAGGRLELRPATPAEAATAPQGSTLVFIGEGLDEEEGWLRMRLSACMAQPPASAGPERRAISGPSAGSTG